MNPYAYRTTGLAIKTLSRILKARIRVHGQEHIPDAPLIFVVNHFTRLDTLLMPYHIYKIIGRPVWSLASDHLFKGALGGFLDNVGAVSTKNPDRDRLIIKSLLTGGAAWIIFPEGQMVKSRKIIEKGRFVVAASEGLRRPRSGAASMALRTEFYRRRLKHLDAEMPDEASRLLELFRIESVEQVTDRNTCIVPVNITYFPLRARENILSDMASRFIEDLPDRILEEIMTEGTMLLSGVDIDIRFGEPIHVFDYMDKPAIRNDISSHHKIDFDDAIPSLDEMRKAARAVLDQYMSAIYRMTTVNLDHLFSSMLKALPRRSTTEMNLRRKVFDIASRVLPSTDVYVHSSLEKSQLDLLTDDGHGYARDFFAVAEEKSVVYRRGDTLEKDTSTFSSIFDMHRVRLDNPITVMANEVEPLTGLQRNIHRTAWTPAFWIRRRLARFLIKQAIDEFNEEYDRYFVERESKEKRIGMPHLIRGNSRKYGILLIHGYMAAPAEVYPLAQFLNKQGYWVYIPRLRGHGTSADDLENRTYTDWIRSVDRGYAIISNLCRNVMVGGFSTGAGLALDLAIRVQNIKAVIAVSPPLRFQDFGAKFVPAMDIWNRLMSTVRLNGARKVFVLNRPENPHINYPRNPVSGVREIDHLMDSVESRLPELNIPALVVQASMDPVVSPKGSRRIFDLIGTQNKRYALFNFERHGILLGEGAAEVYQTIGQFIRHARQA